MIKYNPTTEQNPKESLKNAIREYPDSLMLVQDLIELYRNEGAYDSALALTDMQIKKDSGNAYLWNMKATLLFENEDTLNAIKSLEHAINIYPLPEYLVALGTIYAEIKNPKSIIIADELLKANRVKSGKDAMFVKGFIIVIQMIRKRQLPILTVAFTWISLICFPTGKKPLLCTILGKYAEALEVLKRAVTIQNNFDEGYYWMGKCYEKLEGRMMQFKVTRQHFCMIKILLKQEKHLRNENLNQVVSRKEVQINFTIIINHYTITTTHNSQFTFAIMPIIAPSLLAADFLHLGDACKMLNESEADWFHLDVMDGRFVPNISYGMSIIKQMRKSGTKFFDVHLMIVEPEKYAEEFKDAGADGLTVHLEACRNLHRNIQQIKSLGMKAGVAINPHSPVILLKDIIADIDLVNLMSVNPGFGAQSFIPYTIQKIKELKSLIIESGSSAKIEVDGGVSLQNAKEILIAGADVLVAGNAVFGSDNPKETIRKFKNL